MCGQGRGGSGDHLSKKYPPQVKITSKHMKKKITILLLIFITWLREMLERSPFDLPGSHLGHFNGSPVSHMIKKVIIVEMINEHF